MYICINIYWFVLAVSGLGRSMQDLVVAACGI